VYRGGRKAQVWWFTVKYHRQIKRRKNLHARKKKNYGRMKKKGHHRIFCERTTAGHKLPKKSWAGRRTKKGHRAKKNRGESTWSQSGGPKKGEGTAKRGSPGKKKGKKDQDKKKNNVLFKKVQWDKTTQLFLRYKAPNGKPSGRWERLLGPEPGRIKKEQLKKSALEKIHLTSHATTTP